MWQHSKYRYTAARLELRDPGLQEGCIAAEPVEHDADDL